MKKIIIFIAAMILVFPCILIFNESDSVWVNFVGLAWLLILVMLSCTKCGKKHLKTLYGMFSKEDTDDLWQ